MGESSSTMVEETNQGCSHTNSSNANSHDGVCAIYSAQETALVKGCEHAYCATCILRWASCKKEPTCPQCNNPFEFLKIHCALDGILCLLLRACWFDPLVDEKELEKFADYYYYDDDEEKDLHEIEFYSGRFSSPRFGNHCWVDNEYVSAERQEVRPIQDSGAGPSHQPKKKESHAEELVGRRAKRALKREAADKADVAKHQQHLARLGRMQTRLQKKV